MILNEDTFTVYAAKHYDMKKAASVDEFYDDLKRFQYLKRLFKRFIFIIFVQVKFLHKQQEVKKYEEFYEQG